MNEFPIIEYKGKRVLTTQQLAEAYETDAKTISYNFNHNKERYVEGKHFICLDGDELRAFREIHDLPTNINKLYLWTENGTLLHAKSIGTDKAWETSEYLVDSYFNRNKVLSNAEQIQVIAQGYVELNQRVDLIDKDLQDFKQDMPLLALECERITRAKNRKVIELMGGKESNAYRDNSLRSKVYRDLDSQLRREFGINTYKAIKRSQCDKAIEIIQNYQLPVCLQEQIEYENSQVRIDDVIET